MTKTLDTKLKIESWDEQPYREPADGTKLTRAQVRLAGTDDQLSEAAFEALLYYRADGSSEYVTLMQLTGTLDGRAGSVVLRGTGSFDGTAARSQYEVVAGSGTDGLAGITGSGQSVSTHDDYPLMPLTLDYDLG